MESLIMRAMFLHVSLILLAWLFGSLAFALIVCRCFGLPDPRKRSSGNPGATNVLRLHGRGVAALVLAGDVLKGMLPIWLARALDCPEWVVAAVGLATFLGHLYPVFFGFRGGKGVATLIGVLLAAHWPVACMFLAAWLSALFMCRYVSVASMAAAALTPLFAYAWGTGDIWVSNCLLMALWLIWRHRSNIRKLYAGQEDKLSSSQRGRG